MTKTFRIGPVQQSALEIHIFDIAHEGDSERAIEGRLETGKLVITGCREQAWKALTDAANSCDEDGDRTDRDALTALASRVLRG